MENSQYKNTKVVEWLLNQSTHIHTPSMEDVTYLSSITPEAQQVTARRRPSFSEVSFENEPDLVSAASNPSSLGDIYLFDDPTHHGSHSSIIELTMDPSVKKRKPSHTMVSSEYQPQVALAASNPSSLGDIYLFDDPTHHGSHSSIIELTMDPSVKKRKPSHTMVSSEYQPQVAVAASSPSSLGDIYPMISSEYQPQVALAASSPSSLDDIYPCDDPTYHGSHSSIIELTMDPSVKKRKPSHTMISSEYQPQVALAASSPSSLDDIYPCDDPTYHGSHSSIIELTMDPSVKKRKPSHTMISSEYQPQVALAASNPSSLGDIYPCDDPTHHGSHSSIIELTMDPSVKKRKPSHTMISSEYQPQVAVDLEESPGNTYFDDTHSWNSIVCLSSESDRLSPMLETVKVDPIRCVAKPNRVDMQHLKTIMLNIILQDLDGDNVNQDQNQGAVAQERSVRFEDVTSELLNTEVLAYRTRRDLTKIEALRTLMTLVNENKLSVDTRDGDVIISHYKGRQKTFLTESEDENMILLEVFQPMATENTFCQFQMKKNQPLLQLMISYCIYAEMELSEVKFIFEGKAIKETDTPESLQMENEDLIGVFYK